MVFATARNGIATPTAKQFHHLPAAGTFISEWCGKVEQETMAAENLPEPMTPAQCNLRGLPWMPLETARLLDSDLFLLSTGDEFKAAVTLWCKSWNQIPGGSLPSDERLLEALSGSKCWKKVRAMALRGWVQCSDGRLYHPVIAALAMQAWDGRQVHMEGADAKKTRQQRWREQLKELTARLRDAGVTPPANASKAELERLIALHVDGNVDAQASTKASQVASTRDANEMANKGECKGQGEGQLIPYEPYGSVDKVDRDGAQPDGQNSQTGQPSLIDEPGGKAPAKPSQPKLPPCPKQAIVDLYHEVLPELPGVRVMDSAREKAITGIWKWALTTPKRDGTPRATNAEEALHWLRGYFTRARDNDFIMGRGMRSAEHANWRCSIEYLLSPKGMKKVIEETQPPDAVRHGAYV